jgi:hypothetical protein
MPIRKELYEEMIAEREAAEREASRHRLWFSVRTIAICIGWQLLGGAVVVYAFHGIMPADRAHSLISAGIGLAAGGTLLTVVVRQSRLRDGGYEE